VIVEQIKKAFNSDGTFDFSKIDPQALDSLRTSDGRLPDFDQIREVVIDLTKDSSLSKINDILS
jgi:hypothetical protein